MFTFSVFHRVGKTSSILFFDRSEPLHVVIAIPFLIGIVMGSVIGFFVDPSEPMLLFSSVLNLSHTFTFHAQSLCFFALAIIFSTSYLGTVSLPVLSFFRGFFFAAASAVLITSEQSGIFSSLMYVCIPSLLSIPIFIFMACNGLRYSIKILPWKLHQHAEYDTDLFNIKAIFFILLFLTAEAVYFQMLLPALMR